MRRTKSLAERFWAKVQKSDNCWIWAGAKLKTGYGLIGIGRRPPRPMLAHRASAIIHGMDIDGLCVLHRCDNPSCVNPSHLFMGTQQDNLIDMRKKGRGYVLPPMVGVNNPRSKLYKEKCK